MARHRKPGGTLRRRGIGLTDGEAELGVIVPDRDIEGVVRTLLEKRRESLQVRPFTFDIYRHLQRDSGVRSRGVEFSRGLRGSHAHCLLVFDHEGSGAETTPRDELEEGMRRELHGLGWEDRADVIVISPEIEAWLWGRSPSHHLGQVIGWRERDLLAWMENTGYQVGLDRRPVRPKEALANVLRHARIPRSASIFEQVADRCSLDHCSDPSFNRLCTCLRRWFPAAGLVANRNT